MTMACLILLWHCNVHNGIRCSIKTLPDRQYGSLSDCVPGAKQNVNFFGGPDLSTEEVLGLELEAGERPEERLVFLSNVALDQWADTGERLETLFAGEAVVQRQVPGWMCC
jgi:hypothetical protein